MLEIHTLSEWQKLDDDQLVLALDVAEQDLRTLNSNALGGFMSPAAYLSIPQVSAELAITQLCIDQLRTVWDGRHPNRDNSSVPAIIAQEV